MATKQPEGFCVAFFEPFQGPMTEPEQKKRARGITASRLILPNAILLGEVKKYVRLGSHVTIRTKGNSMLPFIRGEIDSVELSVPKIPYAQGDIVLAEVIPDHYILHRIWEIRGRQVILMGDGNCRGKEKCSLEDIIAKVDYIVLPSERKIDPNKPLRRFTARVWRKLLPVRPYLLAIRWRWTGLMARIFPSRREA